MYRRWFAFRCRYAGHLNPVRLFDESFLLLLLLQLLVVVMADTVAAADVADFVGEFSLRLTIAEAVRSHGCSAGLFLRGCETRRRSARRRIVDDVCVLVASMVLFRAGRFRSRMQHAQLDRQARFRYRYPGGWSSSKTERHRRATCMGAATLRCTLMFTLKH